MSRVKTRCGAVIAAIAIAALAACSKTSTSPTSTNCGAIVGNKGTVTAKVDGTAFSGIVPSGAATNGATVLSLFGQSTDNTTLSVVVPAGVGVTAFGVGNLNAATIQLQTRSCTAGTGLWSASITGGVGTITVTTSNATGASGSFTGTLVPAAGSGASGNKVITEGVFNVTF